MKALVLKFLFIVGLVIFGAMVLTGITRLFVILIEQPKEKCISERTLEGCEQAGFDVERQLERCLWAFEKCAQTNGILQDKLKGEK